MHLDDKTFLRVIEATPLVSIDLLVRNERGQVLLGKRANRPAQGLWFVPREGVFARMKPSTRRCGESPPLNWAWLLKRQASLGHSIISTPTILQVNLALTPTTSCSLMNIVCGRRKSAAGYCLPFVQFSYCIFHLLTHAAFKALLFLAAGSVIHAVGTNLMSADGWAAAHHAGHVLVHDGRPGRARRSAAARRVLEQGRDPARRGARCRLAWRCWCTGRVSYRRDHRLYATRLWLRTFFGAARTPAAAHAHEPPARWRGR